MPYVVVKSRFASVVARARPSSDPGRTNPFERPVRTCRDAPGRPTLGRMERQQGTVKWFSREKGWGFIRLESGDEIFVHHSDVEEEGFVNLEDDEEVEFAVEEMEKGPRARNVRRIDASRGDAPRSAAGDAGSATGAPGSPSSHAESQIRGTPDRDASDRSAADASAPDRSAANDGALRPLAEQLRERLGRYFPGLNG